MQPTNEVKPMIDTGETVDIVHARAESVVDRPGVPRKHGKFELLEQVGAGGFGAVWKARDTELNRIVAIKLLHAGHVEDPSNRERFLREARAAAQLRHPGIATLYEVAELDGVPAIVSVFIDGLTLRDLVRARRLTFREAAAVIAQIADALDYAHTMKLVHRDVKPANIMIELGPGRNPNTPLDLAGGSHVSSISGSRSTATSGSTTQAGPHALLLDFGLALRDELESTLTADGQILGTPAYMSPEQAAGESHHVDRRTDVYSLGVVLYELLTGELPFTGSRVALVNQVLHDEPRSPRQLNPEIPLDLDTICMKAMAKSRGHRYPTARELSEDLRRWLAGVPILARQVGSIERTWRWCRRNPVVAGLLALTALLLTTGTAISTTLAVIAYQRAEQIDAINKDLIQADADRKNALEDAKEQARLAKEHSELAFKTLESVIFDVQTKLANVPNAQQVRGDLLKTALKGLEKLSEKLRAENRVDRSTAKATMELAEVFRQIASDAGADSRVSANQLYEQAVTTFEQLHKAAPEDPVAQADLAEACLLFAMNLSRSDDLGMNVSHEMAAAQKNRPLLIKSKVMHKRAIELRRRLVASTPSDPAAQFQLTRALTDWAYQEVRSGDAEEARKALAESHSVLKSLLAKDPADVKYRLQFGKTASQLGDYYFDMVDGAHEQAAPFYEESLEVLKKLAADRPTDHDVQMQCADAWSRLADLFAARGKVVQDKSGKDAARPHHEKALAAFRKELEITQALEKLSPNNVQTMADSSISYDHVSRELMWLERYAEAIPVLTRVLEIRRTVIDAEPTNRRNHSLLNLPVRRLGQAYEKLNQRDKAIATYAMGLSLWNAYRERTNDRSLDKQIAGVEAELKRLRKLPAEMK